MACVWLSHQENFQDEYEWQSPSLPTFDPHTTCALLGPQRKVLIIGDSTGRQTGTTLMNMVQKGGCGPQIVFQLADTLILQEMGVDNRGVHFMEAIQQNQPDIVIFNAGAHIHTDANYTYMIDQVLQNIQDYRENPNNTKNVTFVWKTQQPAGCTAEIFHPEDPLRAGREFDFPNSLTPDKWAEYSYDKFFERDLYTMARMQAADIHILDLRMLYSRSDAHRGKNDCLHLISPGPLEVLGPLFQKLLMDLEP
jgi:hypothetical protein